MTKQRTGGAELTAAGKSAEEPRLRLLFDSISDYAILMLDPGGIITASNSAAEEIGNYRSDEIVGQHFSRFYTEEERQKGEPDRALLAAARDGRYEKEGWGVRKDGSRYWASVVITPIRESDGTLIGFANVSRDVTERRRAQETLQASERQFRLLVDGAIDYAIFMLDPNGIVTNWNAGAQRIKGYSAAEIVGQHFSRFYTPGDREAGVPAAALEEARRHGRYEAEGWRVKKDGTRFWASVVIDAIREHDRLVGFAKVTRDITERQRARTVLENTRQQLAQAQKMEAIGQLTGGVAHDFNNLLMVIGGRIEVLRRRTTDPAILAGLDAIERAAGKGETLTRQLLAFSRRQALRPTVLDLRTWMPRALEILRPSLRGNIELRVRIAEDVWPIEVDPDELELALLNLAVNARDAMPDGGTLTITATNDVLQGSTGEVPAGEFVRLAISDTGQGIPSEFLPRVFEPFFTTKEVGKGTGLGLSQIYGFATQSGGAVELSSEVGAGTTVILLLPRSHGIAAATRAKDGEPEPVRTSARILLIEDNQEVAEITAIMLRSLGHAVVHAPDARSGLELVGSGGFDLVISDVVMPGGIGGLELARILRERPGAPPVMLVTGYSNAARQAAQSGLTILSKPFQIRALDLAIAAELRRARERRGGG